MVQSHKWNVFDIESMYPYERDLYIDMLKDWIKNQGVS